MIFASYFHVAISLIYLVTNTIKFCTDEIKSFAKMFIFVSMLRALSHMKFHPGVKFSISTRTEKNWCQTWVSTRGETNIYSFRFTLRWKYICKDLQHILQKDFTESISSTKKVRCFVLERLKQFYWLQFIQKLRHSRFY